MRARGEQLGWMQLELEGPVVFSEVWGPSQHRTIEFIFLEEGEEVKHTQVWRELAFIERALKVKKGEIVRSQEDLLAHVGRWPPF